MVNQRETGQRDTQRALSECEGLPLVSYKHGRQGLKEQEAHKGGFGLLIRKYQFQQETDQAMVQGIYGGYFTMYSSLNVEYLHCSLELDKLNSSITFCQKSILINCHFLSNCQHSDADCVVISSVL